MLATGREQRRRADADAAASRDRLDRDIAARRAALVAEVAELERRSAALRAELDRVAEPVATSSGASSPRPLAPLGSIQLRLVWRPGSWRSALGPSARVSAGDGGPTAA
jgi:hypothetical protein